MPKGKLKIKVTSVLVVFVFITSCSNEKTDKAAQQPAYKPESQALYNSIVYMDSLWEDAYNNCKMEQMDAIISTDLEFYHDQGGLSTSKKAVMNAYEKNICGKVTRELLEGSIEVYPVPNFGAVEMGRHRFYTNQDSKQNNHHFSKFVHIWKKANGEWKMTRVISLH